MGKRVTMATAAVGMHLSNEILKQCWFLAGPTAVGKSEVAVELSRRIDAEIVSLDSMSLYRGMDIGTAKPSRQLRELVPHHLIDVIEPHEEFSVAQYVNAASRAAEEIVARQRTPLFVGGTGLYLRSLLRGVFEGPPADPELRSELEAQAARATPEDLHLRLKAIDPSSANWIHPNDVRRMIHALRYLVESVLGGWRWPALHLFGDSTGRSQWAGTAQSCWDIVTESLRQTNVPFQLKVPPSNPPVADRINTFNCALQSIDGRTRYKVHPRCTLLIRDLKQLRWLHGHPDKSDPDLSHAADAEGYRIHWLMPIRPLRIQTDRSSIGFSV